MKHLIRNLWGKLVPSASEAANQARFEPKHMPYDKAYFFTHVPKTGGTSFIVFLDRFFPAKVIFPHQLWIDIGDFKAINRSAYHLIRGHFGGCAVDVISDKAIEYLTIVRDPVKLAYSTYEYVRREKNTALHDMVIKQGMSFETFLTHPKTQHLITNRMVHNLTFGYQYDPAVKQLHLTNQTFADFRKHMNAGQKVLQDDDRLRMAKAFLEQSLWFGVLENFDDSMRLLCFKMAWPPLRKSQKLNINKIKPTISDEARAEAEERNRLDTELYQHAVTHFEQQVAQMKADLGANDSISGDALDDLIDAHYQQQHLTRYQRPLSDGVRYDFSEILLGGQWHRREWNALNKSYFRWTGPGEESFIDFWVQAKNYQLEISVVDAISIELLNGLTISVNDQPLVITHQGSGKSRTITATTEASMVNANGLFRLQFKATGLGMHHQHFGSEDSRLVGFAVDRVTLRSA
ncbi:hypothetical protein [Marinicella meishanensis]|uniref:hypothetical protein n=1 Tax=Marinicella meishanensis TaxID=2873263 RepID=UPI001CBEAA05|nr:hypothetical protein [Marinicella sp. NBU2979]